MENFYDKHDLQYERYIKDEKQSKIADAWFIEQFIVKPPFTRQGMGTQILNKVKTYASDNSYSKVSIFAYSFLVLLYAELIIRYTGINEIIKNIFLFSPAALAIFIYIFLKIKLSQETKNL